MQLFFREDALSVVSMWEKIHAQELDMKDLTRILLLIKARLLSDGEGLTLATS